MYMYNVEEDDHVITESKYNNYMTHTSHVMFYIFKKHIRFGTYIRTSGAGKVVSLLKYFSFIATVTAW